MAATQSVDYFEDFLGNALLLWLAVDAYAWYNLSPANYEASRPSPPMNKLSITSIALLAMVGFCTRRDWRRWRAELRMLVLGEHGVQPVVEDYSNMMVGGESGREEPGGGSKSGAVLETGLDMAQSLQKAVNKMAKGLMADGP
ncbi:hypothetical protein LTR27_012613 [Elasticomyces elasticus]|nr:hypothetical protein LTR27_012613 [Elasticomyces elasticus]